MESHGFVELQDAPDATLRRILALSCQWSRVKRVCIWSVGVSRERVHGLLTSVMTELGGRMASVEILSHGDKDAATLRAQSAAFCLLSSSAMAPHIGEHQVAVFFPFWKAAEAPVVWGTLTGD